jgi:hypothetical protein
MAYRWRRKLRIRWFMVTGYTVALALSWFAAQAIRQHAWASLAVLAFVLLFVGTQLAEGRRR